MPTRDLAAAKEAYKNGDAELSRKAHEASTEEHMQGQGQYIKSIIYGGLDGIITTFAVVAGVAGASLSAGIVLILGFANLFADGLSMAIGDFLSTKAENEYNKAERKREQWEVEHFPDGEKKELVELYVEKGMPEMDAQAMVELIARHPKAWIDIMMVEELGIVESAESPLRNAIATFLSFGVFGFVPLAAHVTAMFAPGMRAYSFELSCILTALTLFVLGALKVRITERNWFLSGIEMLIVGGLAAAAAYGIGYALKGLAGGVA
jgi:VIT1/CCC1 family predicted Fe2+/Mn2+ transporter